MRYFALILALGATAFVPAPSHAQEEGATAASNSAPAPAVRHVTRELPLGNADLTVVEQMLAQTLSGDAKYAILKIKRTVKVTDTPEKIEAVRAMLGTLSQQAAMNVRIEVTVQSMGNQRTSGVDVSGGFNTGNVRGRFGPGYRTPGGISVGGSKGRIHVSPYDRKTSTGSTSKQFILVGNSRTGVIEVVKEIPMVDFFMGYSPWTGFVLPQTRWEKAGTQLLVRPVVSGDQITVEVTPRISNVTFANPDVFSRRPANRPLTGADQYITYTQLTSTVTVPNGGSVTIGGFDDAGTDFNRYFFGGSTTTGRSVGTITLRAVKQ